MTNDMLDENGNLLVNVNVGFKDDVKDTLIFLLTIAKPDNEAQALKLKEIKERWDG